jgi:hypothetical protein
VEHDRPLVALACICEKALKEEDDVMSLIRIVDTFHLERLPEDLAVDRVAPAIDFTIVVSLKSGQVTGMSHLGISMRLPSGQKRELMKPQPMILKGEGHGVNVVARVILEVKEIGLCWFDVVWEAEILTSIPLRLKWQEGEANEQKENSTS